MRFVDNAVKYGPEGQRVTLFSVCSEGQLRVDVGDRGPAYRKPTRYARLFSEFVQLA
jgi:signal transduction histidine kinase